MGLHAADGAPGIEGDMQRAYFAYNYEYPPGDCPRITAARVWAQNWNNPNNGVPAEVMESLTGLVVERREVRPDSGGPGKFRGGCGQFTTFADRSGQPWSMSGMYDRLKFPAQGLLGGGPGAAGSFATDARPIRKSCCFIRRFRASTPLCPVAVVTAIRSSATRTPCWRMC